MKEARNKFLTSDGKVSWERVQQRFTELRKTKTSLANEYFQISKVKELSESKQQRLLDIILSGLLHSDTSIGVFARTTSDYDDFDFFFDPIIKKYHQIKDDVSVKHDWNIPLGQYTLSKIHSSLENVSMRARVARNFSHFPLTSAMTKQDRLALQSQMMQVFEKFNIKGKYYSLTPGHKNELTEAEAQKLRKEHYFFNDVRQDKHLFSAGFGGDWPYGRGIWLSNDKTKMIWVGEQDHLRIISIVKGIDLGVVDNSLRELLSQIEKSNLKFAYHNKYGVVTACPTNLGTSKRQSIFGKFPNLTKNGTDPQKLKSVAKILQLQVRGVGGEHSEINKEGMADLSPSVRFGTTEAMLTKILFEGLDFLYSLERLIEIRKSRL